MFSVLALASAAAAYNATATVESTAYVTIPCSSGDVVSYNSETYTVTEATTLTVSHCGCTETPVVSHAAAAAAPSVEAGNSTAAALSNGGVAAKVGAVAAGAAAVAYLL